MKKILFILLLFALVVTACSPAENSTEDQLDVLISEWEEIENEAEGQTVNLYMWGGSSAINRYLDEWAAPRLKEEADITLNRIPMNDTKDIINQLLNEKQVNKKIGSMDVIWLNGENFKLSKENELLLGAFAEKLPNVEKYVNYQSPEINTDFGERVNGLEAPWGISQFVFVYDSDKVKKPPQSMSELKTWVKENPGKFTYPAPPDFTGSAFTRMALYELTGGYDQYSQPLEDENQFIKSSASVWEYLNDIEPYLWRKGQTYPESLAKADQLYSNGEIWMTMGYDPAKAATEIQKGTFPETTKTSLFTGGTLSNTHYLSIPYNAPNKAGAMRVINFLLSPEAQITKQDPDYWGDIMALHPEKLSDKQRESVNSLFDGDSILPVETLAGNRLPELSAQYVEAVEKGWMEHVAKE
ncbi:ABC transporter substrate-binding protein [Rossellomorea vietnamensis]|uniref:ABC transporter substrate-binding protein n=1 Tax=Rossellomorea vietnamensis TaxID=218284 RepID=A0A5D4MJL6_9BACI|nr:MULTISPECIES: ABC transporter substrate-binding protein [Bacillaceae]TYS01176.1 ABC transporter substrate-binding protein [Rossellomorea vietnamensis]